MLTSARVRDAALGLSEDHGGDAVCGYVYDLAALGEHASRTRATLPDGCRLLYAVKANDDLRVVATLAEVVDGFEVASGGELVRVRAVAPTAPLVFGGPAKTDVELATAVGDHDTIVNVESRHELERLEVVAARHHRQQPACLRVNLTGPLPVTPVAMAGAPTQFGIDEQDVPEILAAARCRPHVDLHGFHFHSVSNHLDAGDHLALVQRYLDHAIAWGDAARGELRTVNIGGGVGVDVHTAIHCFDWSMFTTGLAQARTRVPQSTLMLECGRYLAAACGTYATQVLDVKRTHGQWFALVRGGTHHLRLPVSWGYSHPFEVVPIDAWPHPLPRPAVADARVTVTGELCTPKDVLAADVPVARLRAGDILLFPFAGAYGWSISHHNFLRHPHPRVIYLA